MIKTLITHPLFFFIVVPQQNHSGNFASAMGAAMGEHWRHAGQYNAEAGGFDKVAVVVLWLDGADDGV